MSTLGASDPDRDFSGKWVLNQEHSDLHALFVEAYPILTVEQDDAIHCTATTAAGAPVQWTYRLDGEESKALIAGETTSSAAKWEGAALLVNTLVSGSRDYTIMDRWTLSRDHTQLNIERQLACKARR